jgi:hypothetical protein
VHDSKIVFPHALIHVARPHLAFFLALANQNGVGGYDKSYFQQAKTIADFRKDNGAAIRRVCREFVVLCRRLDLFSQALVSVTTHPCVVADGIGWAFHPSAR